jgi:hypothetical protein
MRTKTLLLTAALSAAGIATSMAQVYSVNAVGYVNTPLVAGFNLISNPLDNKETGGNTINKLFASLANGSQVYKFNGTGFDIGTQDLDLSGGYDPASVANATVVPGQGVFVRVDAPATVTFVGEVPQGSLSNPIPAGLSIVSSQVPQEGTAAALGYLPLNGDQLYFWNEATQAYLICTYDADFAAYDPALPTLGVGEAFFLRRSAAGAWTRTFSVNTP